MNKVIDHHHLPADIKQYLNKYALNKWDTESGNDSFFNAVIVIPALAELDNIKSLLVSLSENEAKFFPKTLILLVINNTSSAKDEYKHDNYAALALLRNLINKNSTDSFTAKIISSGLNIGLVDASSAGKELPEKEGGAGLARKIGIDLALTVLDYKSILTPFLVCLDADCIVEKNYISELHHTFSKNTVTSAYVRFEHRLEGNAEHKSAIICYETYLRYYILALKYAGSHFAFHTVGSTMACSYGNYIKIGGMNKRKAGEDFYFMEKLGKISKIECIKTTAVYPSSRCSWRVPFGTGQRVKRFLSQSQNEYLLYSFESFLILKEWLKIFNNAKVYTASEYLNEAKNINILLYNFLIENKFQQNWETILGNSRTEEQINRQKDYWFDGFKTMKFIHYLRDNGFPLISMFDVLDNLLTSYNYSFENRKNRTIIPPLDVQYEYLLKLRNLEFSVL